MEIIDPSQALGVSPEQSPDELETKLIQGRFSQEGPCPADPL
jgi:hypothetical protein